MEKTNAIDENDILLDVSVYFNVNELE